MPSQDEYLQFEMDRAADMEKNSTDEKSPPNFGGAPPHIEDSGRTETHATGGHRDSEDGKVDFTILPWEEVERTAYHYMAGGVKRGRNNWKKGIPSSRYLRGMFRHGVLYLLGRRKEDHLAAIVFAAWGLMFNERVFRDDPSVYDLDGYNTP